MLDSEQLAGIIGRAIQSETRSLRERIKQLEAREPAQGPQGEPGKDAEITPEQIAESVKSFPLADMIRNAVSDHLTDNPPERGEKGEPGKDAEITMDQIAEAIQNICPMRENIELAVASYLHDNPPADGRDGVDGKDGEPGVNGRDGKDAEVSQDMLERAVAAHLSAYPVPAGRDGRDGIQGPRGADGADGKDGADGINGKDGLGIEDATMEMSEDGRDVIFRLSNGDVRKEWRFSFPFVVDRGVYRDERGYRKGDGVTYRGCYWIAEKDDPAVPGHRDCGWRMAVKKGRDGKNAKGITPNVSLKSDEKEGDHGPADA